MSNENKALELWRQWFEFSGDAWELDNFGNYQWCFFCREREDHGHAKDCVYVQAVELLKHNEKGAETPIHELQGRISKACTSAVLEVLRDQSWRYEYETRYSNSG